MDDGGGAADDDPIAGTKAGKRLADHWTRTRPVLTLNGAIQSVECVHYLPMVGW